MSKKKINLLSEQIMYYADGTVSPAVATSEAANYLKRKGLSSVFVHNSSLSSIGKKLAYKCMGKRYC